MFIQAFEVRRFLPIRCRQPRQFADSKMQMTQTRNETTTTATATKTLAIILAKGLQSIISFGPTQFECKVVLTVAGQPSLKYIHIYICGDIGGFATYVFINPTIWFPSSIQMNYAKCRNSDKLGLTKSLTNTLVDNVLIMVNRFYLTVFIINFD